MRQTISGLVAAIAVMAAGATPAMACGGLFDGGCSPCGYASPCAQSYVPAYVPTYSGCNTGCGAAYERLPDPDLQYGAVSMGLPQYYYVNQGPTYSGPGDFAPYPAYEEGGYSYRAHPRYWHHGRYAPHHMRHGYYGARRHYGYAHRYGYRERVLRRYY